MNIQIGHDAALVESKKQLISGTYLRNAWYCAAWSEALGDNGVLGLTILKEPVVVYRQANGEVVALEDRCAHRFAPLSMGAVVGGNRIQCPYHGLEYDKSGACVLQPHGTKNIPSRARVKSYPAVEKHKAIWVWMGDKAADHSPGARLQRDGQRAGAAHHQARQDHGQGQLRAGRRQPARPLSHTSFLHAGILGNADTVESEITVEQDGTDIVVERHATQRRAARHEQADVAAIAAAGRQDHQHPLDGALDLAADHRHLRDRRRSRRPAPAITRCIS